MSNPPRLSTRNLLTLNTYWFGLSFMWNSLHVIMLPAVLLAYIPETQKNTYLGLLTFFGLIIAMLVQPYSGALSDRWNSRWGRRRPLMLLGTLGDFLFLALLGWGGGIPALAVGYIGLQFSSNIAHGPAQGLLPDMTPPEQLGVASGIKNLFDMGGLIVASLVMGRLVSPDAHQVPEAMSVVMLILAAGAAITLLYSREKSSLQVAPTSSLDLSPKRLISALKQQPAFARVVLSRFVFLLGIYDIQVFLQYYVRDVLDTPNPVQLTGDLMATIAILLVVLSLTGGFLGDRFGHRRIQAVAAVISSIGCLLLIGARTPTSLLLFGGGVGTGIGLFLTANWALANSLVPLTEAGMFMGLTNLATAGSGAVARLGGPLIDLANNAWPGMWAGYIGLFIAGAILTLTSLFFLRPPNAQNPG